MSEVDLDRWQRVPPQADRGARAARLSRRSNWEAAGGGAVEVDRALEQREVRPRLVLPLHSCQSPGPRPSRDPFQVEHRPLRLLHFKFRRRSTAAAAASRYLTR
eukprot:185640-Rhodomonas_salina.2